MPLMIGNVLKNLFSRPVTRLHPLEKREHPVGVRGHLSFEGDKCVFCGDCERACPADAIRLETAWNYGEQGAWSDGEEDGLSWVRMYDPLRCILCGRCAEVCCYGAIIIHEDPAPPMIGKEVEQGHVDTW